MSEMKKRVLVTGGAGFIGSHISEAYLAKGYDVWIVDNLSSGKLDNVPDGASFVELDIRDAEGVRNLFREFRFDLVNHHAAQIDVRISVSDPAKDASINVMGLLNLTEAAIEIGTQRFIFVSSGGVVYGEPQEIPTPETAPKSPLSPYGVTKLAGEFYLDYYRHIRGIDYAAMRYSNVYGPRQDPHGEAGVVAIFSTRLLKNRGLTIFGDGEQTRDYVYVGDVVAANMLVSEMELSESEALDDRAFNVGTNVGTSVVGLADALESVAGVSPGRKHEDERPGELRHSTLNTAKLRSHGWAPAHSLEQGLHATYTHIKNQAAGASE